MLLVLMLGAVAVAADSPANVAGNWTVTASNGRRKITQTLVIQQDGDKISGTFKGPRQSGTLSGSVSGNAVTFHVDAKIPLDYTGTADGDSMTGKMSGEGKTGEFTATRSK
jgi:hypothetical protein